MATNSTISVWPVIGGLIIIGVASYCTYLYIKERRKRRTPNENCAKKNIAEKNTSSVIIPIIKYFSGNMNALQEICVDPDLYFAKITFDNIEQIIEMRGTEEIKNWYSPFAKDRKSWDIVLYKNKAKELINILVQCGIKAHEEKDLIWDNKYSDRYNKLSQIQSGEECTIVAPCWIYNGSVFEKGLVRAK